MAKKAEPVKKVKEFYVVEMANSREDCPDYLEVSDTGTRWHGINSRGGDFATQKAIAIHKATKFESEMDAAMKMEEVFGLKFQYRITKHYEA